MPSATWTIPEPPSANRIWRKSRGRMHRSREYVAWRRDAAWALTLQDKTKFGDASVRVTLQLPRLMRGDVDNRCKASLDLLQFTRVLDDDKQVQEVRAFRGKTSDCRITVETL